MIKKCKKCNEEILDNQKFCPKCGTKQSEEWYYLKDKEPVGPYTDEEIVALYTNGTIQKDTYVWYEGMEEWVSLDKSGLPIVVEEVVNTIENEEPLDVEPMASEEVNQDQKELINGWFIANEGGPLGPYTEEEMIGFIQNKEIDEQTFIWSEGLKDWISVKTSQFSRYLPKEEKVWYYAKGENKYGPLTYSGLLNVCNNGGITSQDYIWKQGWPNWEVAGQTEFSKYCVQTVQAETQGQPVVQKKSKKGLLFILAAAILLSVGGGAYVAYQNKVNAELKQAEEAKAKKEAEKKKQEEEKKKAEEEAKKQEEQEKKEEEAKKLAEEKAKKKEEESKNSLNGIYSVNGSGLDGQILNIRKAPSVNASDIGDYGYGNKVEIVDTIEDGIYLWGKTAEGNYVCISKGSEVYMNKVD